MDFTGDGCREAPLCVCSNRVGKEQPNEKLEKDMEYILNQSLLLDIKIILKTVIVIFSGDGAR